VPPVPHPKYARAKRRKRLRKLTVLRLLVVGCLCSLVLSLWLRNPSGHPVQAPSAPPAEYAPV